MASAPTQDPTLVGSNSTAAACASNGAVDVSDYDSLPTTKAYKLTKDLSSRSISCERALAVSYPEFFHTLNLENFDTASLCAMFYDVQPGDCFLHFLQGARLSFRITRGPKDAPLPNYGIMLGRIRLFTVLGKGGVSFRPNDKLSADNCDLDYEDLPLSLPSACSMADEIKEDYMKNLPDEEFSGAVLEFSSAKRASGIWLKYARPQVAAPAAPVPAPILLPVAAAPPTAMVVDVIASAVPKAKRPRSVTNIVTNIPVVPVPPVVVVSKKSQKNV